MFFFLVHPASTQEEKAESTHINLECDQSKTEGKDSGGGEEAAPLKADADEGSSTALPGAEAVKQEYDDEQESKEHSG